MGALLTADCRQTAKGAIFMSAWKQSPGGENDGGQMASQRPKFFPNHALRDGCIRAASILDCEPYFKFFIAGSQVNVSNRELGGVCRHKLFARKIDAFPGDEPQRTREDGNYEGRE